MLRKLFLKEWKEKINLLIFFIIGMFIFFVIYLIYSGKKSDVLEYLYLAMMMGVLPLTSLFLGSSGFYSEFKDDSWAYLFSRPIKKWKIWFIKYLAQSTILLSIILILLLSFYTFPRLREVAATLNGNTEGLGVFSSPFFIFLLLAFSLFTISFCISFLYEKQFIIIFVSIFIVLGFFLMFAGYSALLDMLFYWDSSIGFFAPFIWLSFILASVLAFIRSDFSQTWKKIWAFSKSTLLFLVLSFFVFNIGLFCFIKTSYKTLPYTVDSFNKYEGNLYFHTDKGIFRYLPEEDKLKKIINSKLLLPYGSQQLLSVRGGKAVFLQQIDWKYEKRELWIMNTDGSQRNCLIGSSVTEGSPLYEAWIAVNEAWIAACFLSKNGKEIVFMTRDYGRAVNTISYSLWRMNSDGTGLKRKDLDFPEDPIFHLLAWSESDNSLIFRLNSSGQKATIAKYDLESEKYRILTEDLQEPRRLRISPTLDFITVIYRDKNTEKETLWLHNLRNFEKKEVYKAGSIDGFKWNQNGDKILFTADNNELLVYSLKKDKIKKVKELIHKEPIWARANFAFVMNDQRTAAVDVIDGDYHLRVIADDSNQEKVIKIPFSPEYGIRYILGLYNIVLVINHEKEELWRVNLDTEEWRRIYH
jgi:ABC-type transport system involved in multi-copper enzyme maturation permease subunit